MSKAERIYVKIDLNKVLEQHLYTKSAGKRYLDLCLVPSDRYPENDWFVTQDIPRAVRDGGVKSPIIGSAKFANRSAAPAPSREYDSNPPGRPGGSPPIEEDSVPF